MNINPIQLEVFRNLFSSIAEEMGVVLRRTAYSPNIKERLDFSCAVFSNAGDLVAQAAHIPVHLGAMPLSVQAVMDLMELEPGDTVILNDPYQGGNHLPDITLVTPVYLPNDEGMTLFGYVANRAHHSDVGGMSAGSMPIARELYQEGLIIPPVKLVKRGQTDDDLMRLILANVRTPHERAGDLKAQIAANQRGADRLAELVNKYGINQCRSYMNALQDYAERIMRHLLASLPDGTYEFTDYLDDDGITNEVVPIRVAITINGEEAVVDFTGTSAQRPGSVNAVAAITLSAVMYVFRTLLDGDVPTNGGTLRPIRVVIPKGSLLNPHSPAPVAGGNVETSQRIVDVLLGALAQAYPERVPAASQGTMNNITIGGQQADGKPFTYYETIGGGMGARPTQDGIDGVHTHMTNTLNTPIEALEYAYPFRVEYYGFRQDSAGKGVYRGGLGLRRDVRLLVPAQITLLTERRQLAPYGLAGGDAGQPGENVLLRDGTETSLPSKVTLDAETGDVISVRTPGGGGYGNPNSVES